MKEITYLEGSIELFGSIKSLWLKQRDHHERVSTDFSDYFSNLTFEKREKDIQTSNGKTYIVIAHDQGLQVGYCIATVDTENKGEIFSLYLMPDYRGMAIGYKLMNKSMDWLQAQKPSQIFLVVAEGNDSVEDFYQNFGFKTFTKKMVLKTQDNRYSNNKKDV